MEDLSNHELAERFLNKQKILGKSIIDIRLLPNDGVRLLEVFDKESTGVFTIPRFITEFMVIRPGSGRVIEYPLFSQCNFSEVRFENNPNIELNTYKLFSNMKSKTLKIRFAHPECITDTGRMFESCDNLVKLDIDGLNTENVTNMQFMFSGCRSLTSLDLRSFNTHKVTDMAGMFSRCYELKSVDLSTFSTQNVKTMFAMFYFCVSISHVDLSSFDTRSLENAESMFNACNMIEHLDLSNFDLRNIRNAKYMFNSCRSLKHIDIGEFNPYTSLDSITFGCDKLDTRI